MTSGEKYWNPNTKKWQGLNNRPGAPLKKLIEKYRDNRDVLEDIAKVHNTDVDTLLQNFESPEWAQQQSQPAATPSSPSQMNVDVS